MPRLHNAKLTFRLTPWVSCYCAKGTFVVCFWSDWIYYSFQMTVGLWNICSVLVEFIAIINERPPQRCRMDIDIYIVAEFDCLCSFHSVPSGCFCLKWWVNVWFPYPESRIFGWLRLELITVFYSLSQAGNVLSWFGWRFKFLRPITVSVLLHQFKDFSIKKEKHVF